MLGMAPPHIGEGGHGWVAADTPACRAAGRGIASLHDRRPIAWAGCVCRRSAGVIDRGEAHGARPCRRLALRCGTWAGPPNSRPTAVEGRVRVAPDRRKDNSDSHLCHGWHISWTAVSLSAPCNPNPSRRAQEDRYHDRLDENPRTPYGLLGRRVRADDRPRGRPRPVVRGPARPAEG